MLKNLGRIFLFGVFLLSGSAHAETQPATSGFQWKSTAFPSPWQSSQSAACVFHCANYTTYTSCVAGSTQTSCSGLSWNGTPFTDLEALSLGSVNVCPSTGGWTLNGTQCTRPDCVEPQVRDSSTGLCVAPPCTAGDSVSFSIFSGYSLGKDQVLGGSANPYTNSIGRCNGSCVFNVASVSSCPAVVGTVDSPTAITCHGTGTLTGATCTNNESSAPLPPTVPHHRPKCLAGEGVLTSSSGTVACVPSGTPSSAPVVQTVKQTQQFPDGSTRTTETTYTKDPVSQVQDTHQQITNTPATGGGAGQAGPVGTTTTAGSTQPSSPTDKEASDFCKSNGQLQICKGDMNKEETQIQVRDYIKSLTDPGSTPFTEIDQAKQSTKSDDDLKEQTDKFQAAAEGTFSPDSASRNSWQSAMDSGWFEPVTRQGCTPYSATIGGRTWNLDICSTAEKISVISEYVIWFMLVVGTFVMLTGGAFSRNT